MRYPRSRLNRLEEAARPTVTRASHWFLPVEDGSGDFLHVRTRKRFTLEEVQAMKARGENVRFWQIVDPPAPDEW